MSKLLSFTQGGLFDLVSCPHYLSECLVYLSFVLVFGPSHVAALLALAWVLSNQVSMALLSHQWYRQKFEDYPPDRKAIFPHLL